MNLGAILQNRVLIIAMLAWTAAQVLKVPMEYLRSRKWNWAMALAAGGMPSSHSALIVSVTQAIGLYQGFDSPLFALGVAVTMIVTYDAAGVRRQAGKHAERINMLFDELMRGQMPDEKELREVLGHTPLEVAGGILLGIVIAMAMWSLWK
ncbi:MAG: divergent PAP2 family protein [Chloroflexi bacterium]|nr:divergent PAP2 family protein [Chloroflexota bacterium]MBI3340468.1 divergent PAP2 family protein [Chloroflexota bacterium]